MIEHPILFTGPLVRAILAGKKTVTRRPITKDYQDAGWWRQTQISRVWEAGLPGEFYRDLPGDEVRCPFGKSGDRLWVRETWAQWYLEYENFYNDIDGHSRSDTRTRPLAAADFEDACDCDECPRGPVAYRADGESPGRLGDYLRGSWRPSVHMPRWACRLELDVVSVRAERLRDITEEDARLEGVDEVPVSEVPRQGTLTYRDDFFQLWDRIYGKGPHAVAGNPWVWRIEFQRVKP